MYKKNRKGIALVIAFLVIVVLLVLGSVFILRSASERYDSRKEKSSIQAFFLAEGGANAGLDTLDILINTHMMTQVSSVNPNSLVHDLVNDPDYVGNGDGVGFLVDYTVDGGVEQFTQVGESAVYTEAVTALGSGTYEFTITITESSDPVLVAEDTWDFPYNYLIEAIGDVSSTLRDVICRGNFTVRVQRDNFARYALFTDHHRLESGTTVWFTDKTHFYGPVHTNERYAFAFNPSGTFDDLVTQHENKVRFYNAGSSILIEADSNPPNDVPTFNAGFTRGVDTINLQSSVQKQDLQEQAWGSVPSGPPLGIYVNNDGADLIGGIYVRGDCTIDMGVAAGDDAVYTITQGVNTSIITVDYGVEAVTGDEQTTVDDGATVTTYNGLPDGIEDTGTIVYVDGEVSSFSGTVQGQSQITVSSENDIIIQNNILYEDFTAGSGTPGQPGYVPPTADGETNLLGILSWGGDVRIGTSAPDDVSIHGIVMARSGILTVDDYDSGDPRGAATLLGGTITQFYGAFGQFDGNTGLQVHGYGRNFIYDARMKSGFSPPYFPSMRTFIAFTNDIIPIDSWQEGGI